jgi:hypothetical protein
MFQELYTHNLRLLLNRETTGLFAKFLHKERGRGAPCSLLKGIVSRDEYFFEGPKTHNSTFWMRADSLHNCLLYFCEENANEIFVSFYIPSALSPAGVSRIDFKSSTKMDSSGPQINRNFLRLMRKVRR